MERAAIKRAVRRLRPIMMTIVGRHFGNAAGRTHRGLVPGHPSTAHLLCLVGAAYRSPAVALAVAAAGAVFELASAPGAPLSDEALAAAGRADEFMI